MQNLSRGRFAVGSASVFAGIAMLGTRASAATFNYKAANDFATDAPVNVRGAQLWEAVAKETGGRLQVQLFGNGQLGGATQISTQLRSGAIQFMIGGDPEFATIVPAGQIVGIPFAFESEAQAYAALEGELGAYIQKQFAERGMHAFAYAWDNGYRQLTANTPVRSVDDVAGLKIRVAPSPIYIDLWRTLGASPTPINVNELYTALQTHIVEAQDNSVMNIEAHRFMEVQKTLNLTRHAWSSAYYAANADAWNALPPDIQAVVTRNMEKFGRLQRADSAREDENLIEKLKSQGMTVYKTDTSGFKTKLAPFYARAKQSFGAEGWAALAKYSAVARATA